MKGKITPPVLLESLRYKWCEQWQRSIFPRFFNWWITELIACAPTAWGEWLSAHRKPAELRWPFQAPSDVSNSAKVCLVLAAEEVWHSESELPKQAAQNLRSVVSYELDKYTPFTHDQIYFDVKARHIEQSDLLQVLLVIVDRPRLDKVLYESGRIGSVRPPTGYEPDATWCSDKCRKAVATNPLCTMCSDYFPLDINSSNPDQQA